MKIVFITPKINFISAGGSVFDIDLKMKAFMEMGAEVHCVTPFSDDNDMPVKPPYSVEEDLIKNRGLLGIALGVYRILKKNEKETDFFHIDGHVFYYGAGLYKRLGGKVPIVAFFNREQPIWGPDNPKYPFGMFDIPPEKKLWRKLWIKLRYVIESKFGTWLANAIEIGTFHTPTLQKRYNDFGLRIKYQLINPDLAGISTKIGTRSETEFSHSPIRLAAAGRFIPTKGFDLLLKAFSLVPNRKRFSLTLAGEGPDEKRLRKLAKEWSVAQEIKFVGWLTHDKLFPFFASSDIFVMPRWRPELSSVVLMEAMSHGLVAVIPKGGGLEWAGGDAVVGFDFDKPEALAKAIDSLSDPKKLAERSAAIANRIIFLHYKNWLPTTYLFMKMVLDEKQAK